MLIDLVSRFVRKNYFQLSLSLSFSLSLSSFCLSGCNHLNRLVTGCLFFSVHRSFFKRGWDCTATSRLQPLHHCPDREYHPKKLGQFFKKYCILFVIRVRLSGEYTNYCVQKFSFFLFIWQVLVCLIAQVLIIQLMNLYLSTKKNRKNYAVNILNTL